MIILEHHQFNTDINNINKHTIIYNQYTYTIIIIKKCLLFFFIVHKNEFYNENKNIFNIDDINVNKILVSKKEQYGKYNSFKYFIGYNDNDVIRPLYLFISQTTGYINKFDKNKITMSLMVKDKQLLKNYNKIWKKIERLMSEYKF